jgi:hypothetical protein
VDVNLTSVVAPALAVDSIAIGTLLHLTFQGYLEILICIINYFDAQGHDFHIPFFI